MIGSESSRIIARMTRWAALGCALMAAIGLLAACGSSSEDDGGSGGSADAGIDAGGSAGASSGGTGGGGGNGGAGGSGGAGGAGGAGGSGGSAGAGGASGGAGTAGAAGSAGGGGVAGAAGGGGSAGAAGAGGGGGNGVEIDFDPASIPEAPADFPVGVQSGDVTFESAIAWTQYTGTAPLMLRVYVPTTPGKVMLYHEATATPDAAGYVHADATGLPWHTELFYVFFTATGRSPIGRFVSAPAPGQKPVVRFAGSSCIDNADAPFQTLAQAGTEDFDFFVFAGDTTYNDSATTLAQYRNRWLGQIAEPGFATLIQSTGHYATWDDHEVDNDWNPQTFNAARLASATQAFFEHLAIRKNASAPNRIWRSYSWGDTIEVFVLDCRSERKPSTASGPNAEYISLAQMAWLKQGLSSSTATFKLIVNSVPISNMPFLFDFYAIDRWEGYAAQRTELLDYIVNQNIPGVLFVSGDFHLGASGRVEDTGKWSNLREVLMGPGAQGANPLWNTLPASQFEYKTGTINYTVFEANPNAVPPTIKVTFKGASGNTLFESVHSY